MPTNRQLGELGYTLQFSTLFAFRTAGMALESWLKGFRQKGLDALADLQEVELATLDGEPRTRMHQKFAGTNRWLTLEQVAKGAKTVSAPERGARDGVEAR
jgi:isocitrate lyase